MDNAKNLAFVTIILEVLGCSCPRKIADLGKDQGSRPAETAEATPSPRSTNTPALLSGKYDVTMARFNKIAVGMKRSDVEAIMGGRGTDFYNGKGGGTTFVSVKWEGSEFKTIFVSFQNEKVTSK